MKPQKSQNKDEVCYPFIYEDSLLCDYEVLTDELCRMIGGILAEISREEFPQITEELETLQPMIYHLNGSIRGKCALTEEDLDWLLACYRHHKDATEEALPGFVLPRGSAPIPQLNSASSAAKKAIRLMVHLHRQEGLEIPGILHRFCNVLCNYLFRLTIAINQARGIPEIPFESASYKTRINKISNK